MTTDIKWLAQLGAAEIRTDTLDQERESYPYTQWVNGDAKLKQLGAQAVAYTGGWFIPTEKMPIDALPGWTAGVLSHKDGETEGWFKREIRFAMMHSRHCWQIGMGREARNYAWTDYDAAKTEAEAHKLSSPRGRLQLLGIIEGLEEVGPMMVTVKGVTAMAFTDKEGILVSHRQHVLRAAAAMSSKASKKRLTEYPRFYFWLPVGPETDAKGGPVFSLAGKGDMTSPVTRPVLVGVAKGMTPAALSALYVGPELIASIEGSRDAVTGQWSGDGLYDQTLEWRDGWNAFGGPAEAQAPVTEDEFVTEENAPF